MNIKRKTSETEISLNLAGASICITTSISMFDHFLFQMAKHGKFNLEITATGDNEHHIIEDVGTCLGQALLEMKKGMVGYSIIPMDDALVMVVVDFGDRGYSHIELPNSHWVSIFLEALAREGRFNLHTTVFYGSDSHHIAEAIFKALGRALRAGIIDEQKEANNV